MKDINQIEMTKSTQGKFYHFFDYFREGFSLPEFKALRSLSRGILASGSTSVHRSACKLNENTRPKKTAERLYRNLKRVYFDERIRDRLLEIQCRKLDSDTVIVVDESDLVKSRARKMEGLKKVRDGSTGKTAPGYDLLNIIACKNDGRELNLLPLSSDLISQKLEADSLHNLLFDRINDIIIHSGNKGIFVFDRGFDSWRVILGLVRNDNAFIIRYMAQRHLELNGVLMPYKAIRDATPLQYRIDGDQPGTWFECGIQYVRARVSDHPSKNAPMVDLRLVIVKMRRRNRRGKMETRWFSFLCRFPGRNWSDRELIGNVLRMYRLRWKIEELHWLVKQDFGWENMKLMRYQSLKSCSGWSYASSIR